MKSQRWFPLLLAALLLLAACGGGEPEEPESGYVLWFCAPSEQNHGPALISQPCELENPGPEELLTALLTGPGPEGGLSPFPRGVTVRRCAEDEERPGVLLVDLSEQYGALADISLTLADYAIVLTLSQMEGVEGVEITAGGHRVSYRNHQLLTGREAVLWDELAVDVQNAFPGQTS